MNHSILHALVQWPLLVCELGGGGLALFAAILVVDPGVRATESAARIVRAAVSVALLWAPFALLHETAAMGAVPLTSAISLVPEVLRETHSGHIWIVRIPALIAWAMIAWRKSAGRSWFALIAGVAAFLLLLQALSGHAIDRGAAAVTLYCVHEMAAGTWFGCLLGLWIDYRLTGSDECRSFAVTASRVSRTAGWSVGTIVVTGVYTAYGSLGESFVFNLMYSAYGRVLLLKLVLVATTLAIGAYNRTQLVSHLNSREDRKLLARNVTIESAILVLVLAVSSVLANTPPAH